MSCVVGCYFLIDGAYSLMVELRSVEAVTRVRSSLGTPKLMEKSLIKLSASSLNLFRECPRCFYLQLKMKIHRPSGPFPSLPGGMDSVIKVYFDKYRPELPPELLGKIPGQLFGDKDQMKKWRNWRTGLAYTDMNLGAQLTGALDDLLIDDKKYIPLDYKTRGYGLKEDSTEFYRDQLNIYEFLLKENGFKTAGVAWLVYFYPKEVKENGVVIFEVFPKKMETNPDVAKKLFESAVQLLAGQLPPHHSICGFCSWASGTKVD